MKKILLLSAYDAVSHAYWHKQLSAGLNEYHWQLLNLPPRYFAWRMGANALNFKSAYDLKLKLEYDLIIATSMTDISTLKGFYPNLADTPCLLYFHENQFDYPASEKQQNLLHIQLTSINSALVADKIVFNSQYNLDGFLTGIKEFKEKMPDFVPAGLVDGISKKASILAVPIATDCCKNSVTAVNKSLQIVWNHRWEYDKGPDRLLNFMRLIKKRGIKFQIHILGESFKNKPIEFAQIHQEFKQQCLSFGYVKSRKHYIKILQTADLVISTALHEFQGIAVMEAVKCGCIPLVPDRLAYCEYYPAAYQYHSDLQNPEKEAANMLEQLEKCKALKPPQLAFHWDDLSHKYQQHIEKLIE
ncbi:MAG: DUF3524 domain-containing protein [Proteobacteria bacterium]|nr:DUF3524 domain-containing protein [Pseudomonadota bacterium]